MKKVFHILKGWGKAIGILPVSTAEKKLSNLRLSICGVCEHSRLSKVLYIINDDEKYENQMQCSICKCPCLEKTLVVDETCPVNKW